jgi:hypothetical protein
MLCFDRLDRRDLDEIRRSGRICTPSHSWDLPALGAAFLLNSLHHSPLADHLYRRPTLLVSTRVTTRFVMKPVVIWKNCFNSSRARFCMKVVTGQESYRFQAATLAEPGSRPCAVVPERVVGTTR